MKLTQINVICGRRIRRGTASLCGLLLALLLVAAQAQAGFQPDLLVKLASESDAAYLGGGVFETTALAQSKSHASFPGTPASFRVLVRNAGDQPDSFQLQGTGNLNGATVRFLDPAGTDRAAQLNSGFATPTLAPGESLAFLVQVTTVDAPLGASFRVSVGAASLADPARTDQVKTEAVACGSSAALVLSAPPDGLGLPGGVVNYPYTVTNVGNAANSFTLASAGSVGWPSAIYADDGAGGGVPGDGVRQAGESTQVSSTGLLAPGASYHFFVAVTVPAGSLDGAHDDIRTSAAGGGASGTDQVTTSAVSSALFVAESVRNLTRGGAFAPATDVLPGDTLEYRMAITNSGTLPAHPVVLRSTLPASTTAVPSSLRIGSSALGDGSACAAALCGWVSETGDSMVAYLGTGATKGSGGSLDPGRTLYVFFRVQVE